MLCVVREKSVRRADHSFRRSSTDLGASKGDREVSTMRWSRPTRAVEPWGWREVSE